MRTFRLGGMLLAVVSLLFLAATSATASPAQSAPTDREESSLTLMVWGPDTTSAGAELRCNPPGGDHPDPLTACDALTAANGDFTHLASGAFYVCTMELRQVTAIAVGTWEGQTVRWHQQYSNPCVLRAETGTVFDLATQPSQ
ncbi:SSI family serine proteinase inhibitor [Actinophytocola sediminis]